VRVERDNTRIESSCTIEVAPGAVISDADNNGVIHIVKDGVTVRFAPASVLRGADESTRPDTLSGTGVRIDGVKNVTVENADVRGFKVGVHATGADGLTVADARFSDNFRQRLASTPQREDSADWLWPHANDGGEWRTNYGGAVVVERSSGCTLRGVRVRTGQNGIILDRVTDSRLFANDCSFLSGWGLAMWRSSGNRVQRNAFDFCIRGHSEGVYNRGQDSAGILMFEQCSDNIIGENSACWSGDGVFAFAGKEALGEVPAVGPIEYGEAGCNNNTFVGNDLSFASAHGLELTFSTGNTIAGNTFEKNGICGVWGGYSRETRVFSNKLIGNGGLGYGVENGGVNIEHGSRNVIEWNAFEGNTTGVHLWWDDDQALLRLPGVRQGGAGAMVRNTIAHNTFTAPVHDHAEHAGHDHEHDRDEKPAVGIRARIIGAGAGEASIGGNVEHSNTMPEDSATFTRLAFVPPHRQVIESQEVTYIRAPEPPPLPRSGTPPVPSPVGARRRLGGREAIVMGEWGPWDHESPFARLAAAEQGEHRYTFHGVSAPTAEPLYENAEFIFRTNPTEQTAVLRVRAEEGTIQRYEFGVTLDGRSESLRGVVCNAPWRCVVFENAVDPRKDGAAWRKAGEAGGTEAWIGGVPNLALGTVGPRGVPDWREHADKLPGASNYGIIATARVRVPAGVWRFATTSDDGVRLTAAPVSEDGEAGEAVTVIENWTHHGPTRDEGAYTQREPGLVELRLEYFQLDGHAVLGLEVDGE